MNANSICSGDVNIEAHVNQVSEIDQDSTPGNINFQEDDSDSFSFTINPFIPPIEVADLSIELTNILSVNPTVGDILNVTVTILNNGPDTATGVEVSTEFGNCLQLLNSSIDAGTYNEINGIWSLQSILSNESINLSLSLQTFCGGLSSIEAFVNATDQEDPDSNPGNNITNEDDHDLINIVIEDIEIPEMSDIELVISPNFSQNPVEGDPVGFTLTAFNQGPNIATNIIIQQSLTNCISNLSVTGLLGNFNANNGLWFIPSLGINESADLLINLNTLCSGNEEIVFELIGVSQNDPDSSPNNQNDLEDDQTNYSFIIEPFIPPVEFADLSVQISSGFSNNPFVGDQLSFSGLISNAGPDTATNIEVQVNSSSCLEFSNVNTSNGDYNHTNGIWSLPELLAGQTLELSHYF